MAVETGIVYRNYIGGQWREAKSRDLLEMRNPANGEIVARAQRSTAEDVQAAVAAARQAFESADWRDNADLRTQALFKLVEAIRGNVDKLAQLLTLEGGKPLSVAKGEAARCAVTTEYFAGLTRWIFGRSHLPSSDTLSILLREPVGVVGIIVPWNMPLALLIRALAPALAAGNAVVIKPASYTSASAAEFVKLFDQIPDFPKGIVNLVTGPGDPVGAELARHEDVDMISFTGDTSTGKEIMRLAATNLKKISLELGGKSPSVVFADASFDRAVKGAINAASFYHAGQICIAGTRVLVEDSIHDQFVERAREIVAKLKVGPGMEKGVEVGPVISEGQLQRVLGYVETGKKEAKLVVGGQRLRDGDFAKGYFVAPTIFDEVSPEATIAREEIFGPVMSVLRFKDVNEAVHIANNTVFGLVAAVWTRDINKAMTLEKKIRAGTVWVNTFGRLYQSTEMGGFKQSGLGRQYGLEGLLEYTELKHINIKLDG
jgi:betaine-aldehyde dehydrogenase